MTLLVLGKTGQVATELRRLAPDAMFLDRAAADLSMPESCAAAISALRPDAIINAAAWTAVDRAEAEEAAAHLVNAASPGALAKAAADLGVPFLHVSTDYVFPGTGTRPWREDDQTDPQNAYGRTKLAGERAVIAAGGHELILRTAWVFSAHGTNFIKTMLRLSDSRDALNVVDDQIGGPTPAADIARTLLALVAPLKDGAEGGIFHYAGQPHASWADLARETFALAGRQVVVTGIPTEDFPTPAKRPLNSRLDGGKLEAAFGIGPPDWRAGLAQVIKDLSHA